MNQEDHALVAHLNECSRAFGCFRIEQDAPFHIESNWPAESESVKRGHRIEGVCRTLSVSAPDHSPLLHDLYISSLGRVGSPCKNILAEQVE